MRKCDALVGYPEAGNPRYVGPTLRTTQNRIITVYRDKEPYDGDWKNGCPAKYIGYDLYLEPLLQETSDFHS